MKNLVFLRSVAAFCAAACVGLMVAAATPVSAATLTGNATFDQIWYRSGSSYFDRTGSNNEVMLGSTGANEALYLGSQSPFKAVSYAVKTQGGGSGVLSYQYSTPLTIQNLSGFTEMPLQSDSSNYFKDPVAVADVEFMMPNNWVKSTVNGVSMYWIKVSLKSQSQTYFPQPVVNGYKATTFNLKTQVNMESGAPIVDDIGVTTDAACQYLGQWSPGQGVHYFSTRTDGGSCSLTLKGNYYGLTDFHTTVTGLTKSKDVTSTPYLMKYPTKVSVTDEVGNPLAALGQSLSSAGVSMGNIAPSANNGTDFFFTSFDLLSKVVSIAAQGYVTQDGSVGNTALAAVDSGTLTAQTSIRLLPANPPCTAKITAGAIVGCGPLMRDETLSVMLNGGTVAGANVTLYTDSGMTTVANDLSKVGQAADAQAMTDASGVTKMALASGTYYYKVTASGNNDKTGSIVVTSGVANSHAVEMSVVGSFTVSGSLSTVIVAPSSILADGSQTATVTATIKDTDGNVIDKGLQVTAMSSISGVTISPSVATAVNGVATFTVKSSVVGSTQISLKADGLALATMPTIQFTSVSNPNPNPNPTPIPTPTCNFAIGSLVKLPDDGNINTQEDSAVYYYGKDCKRHAFSNSRVYFTWFANFNAVTVISPSTLASMPLGKNLGYRPGVKMVKFKTLNKVYVVGHGGLLRWVKTEAAAIALYGNDWNKKIDDIEDTFYGDYSFGADVSMASDFNAVAEQNSALTINDNL